MKERVILSMNSRKDFNIISELLNNKYVKDIGEETNKEFKEQYKNDYNNIELGMSARSYCPDFLIIDKEGVKRILAKYRMFGVPVQNIETKEIYNLF